MLRRWLFAPAVLGGLVAPLQAQLVEQVGPQWQAVRDAIARGAPDLVAARGRLGAATSRARVAGVTPPSALSAEIEEGGHSARMEVSRELWVGGRRSAERSMAEREADQARVELEIAERRVQVLADVLLLRAAGSFTIANRVAIADSLLAGAEEALRTRFGVGAARYGDLLRLRAERIRIQADRVTLTSRARENRAALLALLPESAAFDALASDVDRAIAMVTVDTGAASLVALPPMETLLSRAGPIRRATAAVATVRAARSVAAAARRPTLSAALGVQRYEGGAAFRFGPTVSATLALPFTSAAPGRAVSAADLDIAAADAGLIAATVETRARLKTMLERYETARQRLAIYDAALLTGAREEREAALASYRNGDVTLLELLDFEIALTRAETTRLATRIELAGALAALLVGENL